MQIRFHWQIGVLASVTALAPSAVSARPQDQITLIHDAEGRAVYVNAAEPSRSEAETVRLVSSAPGSAAGVRELISQTAQSLAVDPKLVEAVVRVESAYDARARSPKGALGLMQLMPATAARFGVENAFDSVQNIRGGVSYLGHLLRQFNGDVPLSLAAYNAGEGAVLRERGIPRFQETRDYVRKVTALYPSSTDRTKTSRDQQRLASSNWAAKRTPTPDNLARPIPIYRYVDRQGVIHFSQ
jgi:soluble lytic murein transglycosylase-like protein